MACHYPPDTMAPHSVQQGAVFTRWCPILKRFETARVLSANPATGLCRVLTGGETRIVSMTEIRARFPQAMNAEAPHAP